MARSGRFFSKTTLYSSGYDRPGTRLVSSVGCLGVILSTIFRCAVQGLNHQALDFGFFIPLFIIVAVVARMTRYFVAYEITKAIYPFIHKFVRKHYAILFVVAVFVFTLLLMRVSQAYM